MTIRNQVRLEFRSVADNVGMARLVSAQVAAALHFGLQDVEDLKVAVSEAVSNAIIHGYNHDPSGVIRMTLTVEDDHLEIVIEDEGAGIENVEKAMEPAFSTDPERMGLGFVFMKSFMDRVEVESQPGKGTRVRMSKAAADPAALAVQ